MLDAAIIGTGPAGLSAALNLKLHNRNFMWFGPGKFGSELGKAEELGLTVTEKMVTKIMKAKNYYMILAQNEIFEARTILLATGVSSDSEIKGERELLGKGVSYCATCDGFLYEGKKIVVYCSDRQCEQEVEYLAGFASQVYLDVPYQERTQSLPNVKYLNQAIDELKGVKHVNAVVLSDGSEVAVDGVFLLRSVVAPAVLLPGLKMDGEHVAVDKTMKTNYEGCYAAGDCTGTPYQTAKAIGEGTIAAHSMITYLSEGEQL